MQIVDVKVETISTPAGNPNEMDAEMFERLGSSIDRFGVVVPLAVRETTPGQYETIGGAHRLSVARRLGHRTVACIVVQADDAEAQLLSQALNRIHGQDDLGLRAEALRQVLEGMPSQEVLSILPETAESLADLTTLGTQDLALGLQAWEAARAARLRHLTFQLVPDQLEVVERALDQASDKPVKVENNPNSRGNALYAMCLEYLGLAGVRK